MGNTQPSHGRVATLHASIPRLRSTKSSRSVRSLRRVSLLSTRERDIAKPPVPERLPEHIDSHFEIDPIELKMQRNLCGCRHPLVRVDIVLGAWDDHGVRRSFVDRRIALHADADAIRLARQELEVHSYLAHQFAHTRPDHQQHPFLALLHGHFIHHESIHILTEYYPIGNLLDVIHPETSASLKVFGLFASVDSQRDAMRQLCAAVAFVHREGVVHMDIALDNIYVDAQGGLHLGDFRHAVVVGKTPTRKRAAPPPVRREYAAPELFSGREVNLLKVDAWSVGICILMLLTKQQPFVEATTADVHYRLLQVLGLRGFLERMRAEVEHHMQAPVVPIHEDFVQLLVDLLVYEPDARRCVQEVIAKYSWLKVDDPRVNPPQESTEQVAQRHDRFPGNDQQILVRQPDANAKAHEGADVNPIPGGVEDIDPIECS